MTITHKLAALPAVAILLLSATGLAAQGIDLGGKLTASQPEGQLGNDNFLNGEMGYGYGLHLAIAVPGGALVPRVDYTVYENRPNGNARANMLQAGVDYDFYFRHQDRGSYGN